MSLQLLLLSLFQKIWAWIDQCDHWLFLKINSVWTNSFFDTIFPWWREANTWVPVYLFFIVFSLMNYKKRAVPWILFVVVTLTITDQLSSTVIKNWIARPRPCRDEFLMGQVRLLLDICPGGYSFPSSHATNHFGFSMFIFITLKPVLKKRGWLFFVWAATICYGQMYVGVHYPVDIFCGAVLGCIVGYFVAMFYNKKVGPLVLDPSNQTP